MIKIGEKFCPICGGELKFYDKVKRLVRTKWGKTYVIFLRRFHCKNCGTFHREITDEIFAYKQYEAEIIIGVLDGLITSGTLGFEDYPCEMTILRWKSAHFLHNLL